MITVGDEVLCVAVPRDGRPLNWRLAGDLPWQQVDSPPTVAAQALQLSSHFRLGHSSQDWIESTDGRLVFVRLRPAADWLFLPGDVVEATASHLARLLAAPL